jgi:hypothetical protein
VCVCVCVCVSLSDLPYIRLWSLSQCLRDTRDSWWWGGIASLYICCRELKALWKSGLVMVTCAIIMIITGSQLFICGSHCITRAPPQQQLLIIEANIIP